MIAQSTIEQVRNASPVQVLSTYIKLVKKGVNYTGCCPFHNEKSPSFMVSDSKGIYKCFGCGKSGDVISFVMEHEKKDFIEAVEIIATIAGISVEYTKNEDKEKYTAIKTKQQQQHQAIAYAADFYHQQLLKLPEDHPVIQHLRGRGWNNYTIIKWNIGWASPEWRQITEPLINQNLYDAAHSIGIISTGKDNSHYDTMRSRIIFPIKNQNGQFIGLGGRWMPVTEKDRAYTASVKYINTKSDEESIYQKNSILYGLNKAMPQIKKRGFAWLIEGYADVISMHAYGDANAVGICGTSFTPAQAQLLKKYTSHVVIIPDNDSNNSGEKSAIRTLSILLQYGFKVDIAKLPVGKDPDEFLQSLKSKIAA